MESSNPDPTLDKNGQAVVNSVADELRRESERLRQLAEQLQKREAALAEMELNYPYFKQFVYAKLREELEQSRDELPDTDLETLARLEGALPLEAFIDEIENPSEEP